MNGNRISNNAIIIGIVVVVSVTILAAAAVLIFAPDADIAPLIGTLGPTVAALGALAAVHQVGRSVERVEQTTDELANGKMDAKIRAGVADVIPDEILDDTYRRQRLAADRIRARGSEHQD